MVQLVDLLDVQLRNLTPGGKDSAARSLNKVEKRNEEYSDWVNTTCGREVTYSPGLSALITSTFVRQHTPNGDDVPDGAQLTLPSFSDLKPRSGFNDPRPCAVT